MKPQAGTLYWVALIKSKRFGNAAAKTTMFVLADYVGGDDECHPGVDRVAAETELSPYQARKALVWLKEAGLLQQTRRVNGEGHRIENGLVLDRDGVLALPDVVSLDAKTAPRPSAVLRSAPSAVLGESPSAVSLPGIADKASQEPPIEPNTCVDEVDSVFEAWKNATGRSRCNLDAKRKQLIAKALKGYPLDDVLDAVKGWRSSAYHRGENASGTVYDSLGLLLRDAEHIEKFRDLARNGSNGNGRVTIGHHGEEITGW